MKLKVIWCFLLVACELIHVVCKAEKNCSNLVKILGAIVQDLVTG